MHYYGLALPALLLCFLFPANTQGQSPIPLHEALRQGLVELENASGLGGYRGEALQLTLHNHSRQALAVEVWPGSQFASDKDYEQDLIITAPAIVQLPAGSRARQSLFTMCTQAWNTSPAQGSGFQFRGLANGELRKLVNCIAANNYQTSTAQSAVWAISSREPVSSVYGEDPDETQTLAEVLSEALAVPMDEFDLTPRRHQIWEINASMEAFVDQHLQRGRLALFNDAGEQVREYFRDKFVEKGFQQFRVGASHTGAEADRFWLRLFDGQDHLIAEQAIAYGDTVLDLPRLRQEAVLGYELRSPTQVTAGLYDAQGRLHLLLGENREKRPGYHRSRLIVDTPVLPDETYYLMVVSGDKVLARQQVVIGDAAPELHAQRQVSGSFAFTLPEALPAGRVALYDEQGRLKRIMNEFTRLSPGQKNYRYRFTHRDGPEAVFYLRIESPDGREIWQEKVIGAQP